jgi:hypothetical protein
VGNFLKVWEHTLNLSKEKLIMDNKLKELLVGIKAVVAAAEFDIGKFVEKGNKSAGGRGRKDMQALKKLAQEVRVEITAQIKAKAGDTTEEKQEENV